MAELPAIALSVRQPWAWAIIHAGKDIENRSAGAVAKGCMTRRIGQRITIHASRGMTQDEYRGARAFMAERGLACPDPWRLEFGAVIGSVRLVDIVKASDSPWWIGPRGLVLTRAEACAPVSAKGELGMFWWKRCASDALSALPKWLQGPPMKGPPPPDAAAGDLFKQT